MGRKNEMINSELEKMRAKSWGIGSREQREKTEQITINYGRKGCKINLERKKGSREDKEKETGNKKDGI